MSQEQLEGDMARMTAYAATMARLHDTDANYSWERHHNGSHTLYVYPPVLGQDADGDWLRAEGPEQVIRFRENGSVI